MFRIVMVVILSASLYEDFKKDKGLHIKAKTVHALFLVVAVFLYSDMIRYLGKLIRKFKESIARMSEPIGLITGDMHLIINLVKIFVGVGFVYCCFQMAKRKESGKQWAFRLLPLLTVTEIISFYGGWIEGTDEKLYHWLGIGTGFVLLGGICLLIIVTYSKDFMIDFYEKKDGQQEAIENFGKDI